MDLTIVTLVEMIKKKYMLVLCRELSRNDITIKEVVLHTKYTDIELDYLIMYGKLRGIFVQKWEIVKKCRKYKTGDKYCNFCIKKKFTIDFYNNPNELLNQKSEIPNVCRQKKGLLLGRWGMNFYLFIIPCQFYFF